MATDALTTGADHVNLPLTHTMQHRSTHGHANDLQPLELGFNPFLAAASLKSPLLGANRAQAELRPSSGRAQVELRSSSGRAQVELRPSSGRAQAAYRADCDGTRLLARPETFRFFKFSFGFGFGCPSICVGWLAWTEHRGAAGGCVRGWGRGCTGMKQRQDRRAGSKDGI